MPVFGTIDRDFATLAAFLSLAEVGHVDVIFISGKCKRQRHADAVSVEVNMRNAQVIVTKIYREG
jgi:hypothetical protein